MDSASKEDMNLYYSGLLKKYGATKEAVAYKKEIQQLNRYGALANIEPISRCSSVLDVGCGLGYFANFLSDNGWQGTYTGIDINPELVDVAGKRFTKGKFLCMDLLTDTLDEKYDYVFCGATLQHKPKYDDPLPYLEKMIARMFSLTKRGLGFDVFSDRVDYKRDVSLYVSPSYLLEFCYGLTQRLVFRNDLRPYEIMIYMYKDVSKDSLNTYMNPTIPAPVIL